MTSPLVVPGTATGADPTRGSLTFVGTATTVIELAGLRILTDPNFLHQGQHAKLGYGLRSERLTEPALSLEEVLPVDLVVLSHHHGDHFDEVAAEGLPKDLPIVTNGHAARKLGRQGFTAAHALGTWESVEVQGPGGRLAVTALPGQHAPQPLQALLPPVMGSLLDLTAEGASHRTYVSGDTLLHDALHEIPRRFPGIDLAVVHLGGTRIAGVTLTMTGPQGAEALEIIDADDAVPVHYDDYTVFKSPLSDFREAVAARDLRTRVHYLDRGDSLPLEMRRG